MRTGSAHQTRDEPVSSPTGVLRSVRALFRYFSFYFSLGTRANSGANSRSKPVHPSMLLDVLTAVHAFVVAVFVVSYWRGLWYLLNEYLEPKNLERSGWLSVAAAAGLASVCWVLIRRAGPSMRASRAWPAWEALYTQLACAAGVFAWRGIWVLEVSSLHLHGPALCCAPAYSAPAPFCTGRVPVAE